MGCCANICVHVLPTNASTVAFCRTSYGNEPLYEDVHKEEELLRVPDPENACKLAEDHLKKYSFRDNSQRPFTVWGNLVHSNVLNAEAGIGLQLYFFSLKYFAVVFFTLSLIALGQIVLDYDGEYYRSSHSDWSAYFPCLGNVMAIPRDPNTTLQEAQTAYRDILVVKKTQVIVDALYTSVFIIAIIIYSKWTRKLVALHRKTKPTLADFSVKLTHLPENRIPEVAGVMEAAGIKVHEMVPVRHVNKLEQHFMHFHLGKKKEVLDSLVYACYPNLKGLQLISHEQMQTNRYVDYRDIVEYKLGVLRSQMLKSTTPYLDKDLIEKSHSLIVVFETRKDRRKALRLFRQSLISALWTKLTVCYQKLRDLPRNWLKEVNAKWMAVPKEVYWENIKKKQYLVRLLYYYVTVIVILVSAAIVFGLRGEQNDVDDNTYEHSGDKVDSGMNKRVQSGSIKFLIGACIVFFNGVITWIFNQFITSFERQSTLPRLKLSAMFKNFFFVLINSAFIILIVNADFRDFKVYYVLRMIDSRFKDYSRDWYLEVGFSIFLSMLLGIFSPHALWCLYYTLKHRCLGAFLKYFDTQLAFNHWALGGDMDLAFKTALQLVAIYCCFMYAGGMPLMLPICCITMASMFICDTYLLRYLRKPQENSTILHTWLIKLLPGAIVIHCGFSAYMYGADSIFPHQSPEEWFKNHPERSPFVSLDYISDMQSSYKERSTDYSGVTFLLLCAIATLTPFLNAIMQRCFPEREEDLDSSVSAKLQSGVEGGDSYYIFRNKHYEEFYQNLFMQHQSASLPLANSLQPAEGDADQLQSFVQPEENSEVISMNISALRLVPGDLERSIESQRLSTVPRQTSSPLRANEDQYASLTWEFSRDD